MDCFTTAGTSSVEVYKRQKSFELVYQNFDILNRIGTVYSRLKLEPSRTSEQVSSEPTYNKHRDLATV